MRNVLIGITLALMLSTASADQIRVHSHRGETDFAPENTVESIKLAFDMGSLMIETDFWLTKDGQMVCMHGPYELNDVWGIKKSPENLTPEEIKNARLAKPEKYDKKYSDCRIPLIDDVFAIMPKDKRFELEVKGYGESFADKVEAARKKAGLDYWNIMVTSFEPSVIKDFKSKYPKYETALIVWLNPQKQSAEDIVALAKDAGASEVSIGNYRKIDRAFVKKILDAGIKVNVWQVENLDDLVYAAIIGALRVCSNHAYRLREDFKILKELDFK